MRNISTTALQSILAEESGEVWLACVTIDHPSMATPIRVVNDQQDLVRTEGTFIGFPFMISLPADAEDDLPEVGIKIDNVDQTIIQELRSFSSGFTVKLEIVLASSPNTVEAGPFDFVLKDVQYNRLEIQGRLGYEVDLLNDGFPAMSFNPNTARGMF